MAPRSRRYHYQSEDHTRFFTADYTDDTDNRDKNQDLHRRGWASLRLFIREIRVIRGWKFICSETVLGGFQCQNRYWAAEAAGYCEAPPDRGALGGLADSHGAGGQWMGRIHVRRHRGVAVAEAVHDHGNEAGGALAVAQGRLMRIDQRATARGRDGGFDGG